MTRRRTTGMGLAGVALMALTVAGLPTQVAQASAGDYWVVTGDQATNQLIAYDPAVTDWTSSGAVKWSWHPTTALGFTSAEIAAFGHVTDFKLRNTSAGQRVVITASDGLAAIISYPAGVKQWATTVAASDNLHAAELLPNGNLIVTSTNDTTGYVRVYASSQGPTDTDHADYPLDGSHGAIWDPTTERVWVIGKTAPGTDPSIPRILTALAVTGSNAHPRLTQDQGRYNLLPDIGSHDLTPDPNDPNLLLLSTASHTYQFDKTATTNAFTTLSDLIFVKSISRQPSGQLVQTQADEHKTPPGDCTTNDWCTDTVDFYGPDTTRTVSGAQFYRARVWNPYYNAAGDTVHGPVSDRTRATDGTWSAASQIDANTAIATFSAAALPDGTLHVQTVVPGSGVWDRTRSTSGIWSTSTQIDSNGAITAISAAALPDGSLHVQTVVPGSGVWDRTRSTSGTWSAATQIDSNGLITDVSAAGLPNGILHVQTLVPGSGVWDRTRSTSGTWSTSSQIAAGCAGTTDTSPCVAAISAAALPDGTLHVQTLTPGSGVSDMTRNTSGTWSTPSTIDANDSITRVTAAALPDGTLHVQTVVPDHGLWDRTRSASGTWSSATKLDPNTAILDTYGAGLPDGTLHVGSVAYAG